jgi:hypothetical protein
LETNNIEYSSHTCPTHIDQYLVNDEEMFFTRKENYRQGDHFLFIESLGVIELKRNLIEQYQYYGLKVKNLSEGFIHFGICMIKTAFRRNNCLLIHNDESYDFHGINISYFAPNCFHFDQYVNGIYEMTSNNCLSEFEILELEFSLKISYDSSKRMVYLQIFYNGNEYYNYYLRTLANYQYDYVSTCMALGTKDSQIQFIKKETYP